MQLLAVFALCQSLCATALHVDDEVWEKWKQTYGKAYNDNGDDSIRRRQFESNVDIIARHNAKYELGLTTFTLGLNQFADLSADEFKRLYLSGLHHAPIIHKEDTATHKLDYFEAPKSFDWRKKGLVTQVKDQGYCGSCWAFSSTGAIEAQYAKKKRKLLEFSEQQLVDCSREYGNLGCHGGLMVNTFSYLHDFGLEKETDYPYTATEGYCAYNPRKAVTRVADTLNITYADETDLKNKLAKYGPVSVAIDAESNFQLYREGIFVSETCSETMLNHAVLAVGYGALDGQDYWIIKNSWGSDWGAKGYILFARNRGNMCGIASAANIPIV